MTAPNAAIGARTPNAIEISQSAFSELERAHKAIRRYAQSIHPDDKATALLAADNHTARALMLIRSIKS